MYIFYTLQLIGTLFSLGSELKTLLHLSFLQNTGAFTLKSVALFLPAFTYNFV